MYIRPVLLAGVWAVAATSASAVLAAPAQRTIGTKEGQMYPDFLLPNLDGRLGRLSDHRGKKVLLIHFASW